MIQPNWSPNAPYCIYKHTSPSGKVYVGQTKQRDLRKRWRSGNIYGYCEKSIFRKVIDKYGWNNIKHEIIIDGLTKSEANAEETKWIAHFKEMGLSYNVSNGGDGNSRKMTEETKAKISAAHKGKKRGPHSKEWCANISKHRKGIKYSDIAMQHMKEAGIKRRGRKMQTSVVEKNRINMTGRIWVNNGVKCKMCKPDEFNTYIGNGWCKGRLKSLQIFYEEA